MTARPSISQQLDQLREDVDYLTALVEPNIVGDERLHPAATDFGGTVSEEARAHIWHTLTRSQAAAAWTTLLNWVDWLIDRYQLDGTPPDCWYRHGAMVDELDALRAAWVSAYIGPAARPPDAAYWHELLARTLSRLRDGDRYGCAAGRHRDDTATWNRGAVQDRTDYVSADLTAHSRHGEPQAGLDDGGEGDGSGDGDAP